MARHSLVVDRRLQRRSHVPARAVTVADLVSYLVRELARLKLPNGYTCEITFTVPVGTGPKGSNVTATKAQKDTDFLIWDDQHRPSYGGARRTVSMMIDTDGFCRVDVW